MDRVILSSDDVARLLKWRDQHVDLVRRNPGPLKAVLIQLPETEIEIKAIRSGSLLKLNLNQAGKPVWHCKFHLRHDGRWEGIQIPGKASQDDVQSVLTVYCSLMAMMTYHVSDQTSVREWKESSPHKASTKPNQKKVPHTTYILRMTNGSPYIAPRGSHASPTGIFTVRGHFRYYKSGKVVWISEYQKGTGDRKRKTYKLGGEKK